MSFLLIYTNKLSGMYTIIIIAFIKCNGAKIFQRKKFNYEHITINTVWIWDYLCSLITTARSDPIHHCPLGHPSISTKCSRQRHLFIHNTYYAWTHIMQACIFYFFGSLIRYCGIVDYRFVNGTFCFLNFTLLYYQMVFWHF